MPSATIDDLAASCIRCGFCLEACPTFGLTGTETESPRGRIYLIRSADEGVIDWEDARPHLDRCLGCLACETACPSGVQYGGLLELARDRLGTTIPRKALLETTTNPTLLKGSLLWPGKRMPGFFSRLVSGRAPEADLPTIDAVPDLPPVETPVRGEVFLLEGCAMRVLFPRVHWATRRLLARVGYRVREVSQGCCGAMHAHNGDLDGARSRATALTRSFAGDLPVVVNSAGCGSTMREYGTLIGDQAFADRTIDLSEFLLREGLPDRLRESPGLDATITYHDACHLAHGQGVRSEPRELLAAIPRTRFVELDEADTCCGSAGIYNVTQPEFARRLLDKKWANVEATGASLVATGNPGCHAWIAQAAREAGTRVAVLHTAETLERSFNSF